MIQVIRRNETTWDVLRVDEIWKGAHEYEAVGRVVLVNKLYYVQFPEWNKSGVSWVQQPRSYLLPRVAFKVASAGAPKKELS